uniref:Uncharacterized protein n=1 Tax=Brassica oleracea TaxID=3712 RepID=A0A3P6DKA5_BRAOL|nr:unnamed protein product [Brassica oleracea]
MGDSEDDDEEPLVIVADPDPNQPMEEQLWGEDGLQAASRICLLEKVRKQIIKIQNLY